MESPYETCRDTLIIYQMLRQTLGLELNVLSNHSFGESQLFCRQIVHLTER